MRNRILDIEGGINFRDIGGYTNLHGQCIKWNKVFRSGQLNRVTDNGLNKIRELEIRHVFDLRSNMEIELFPSKTKSQEDIRTFEHPQFESPLDKFSADDTVKPNWSELLAQSTPAEIRKKITDYYPQKLYSHKGIYKQMLLTLINTETPILFHCAAGKDRTGVGATILMSLLDIQREVIIEDYLITKRELSDKVEGSMLGGTMSDDQFSDLHNHFGDMDPALLKPLFDTDENYIKELFNYVDKTYGTFTNYVSEVLEIPIEDINSLKSNLLE